MKYATAAMILIAGAMAAAAGIIGYKTHAAAKIERPIIAELLYDPQRYMQRPVAIYGLVIESESNSVFVLQDVSQKPLKIIGAKNITAKVGDQITVGGTLQRKNGEYFFSASTLTPTRVLGGGGCC